MIHIGTLKKVFCFPLGVAGVVVEEEAVGVVTRGTVGVADQSDRVLATTRPTIGTLSILHQTTGRREYQVMPKIIEFICVYPQ